MRFLLLIVLVFGWEYVQAQMTDAEVVETAKIARAQGMGQQEIVAMLIEKGVTEEQVLRIKASYEQSQGGGDMERTGLASEDFRQRQQIDSLFSFGAWPEPNDGSQVFGRSMFSNKRLTFMPNLNIPTPEGYQLGPGDEVIIDIWGNSEMTIRQQISPDGSITVESIGPIYLSGKKIEDAAEYLKNVFGRIYSDLTSSHPQTFLKVTLGQIRSIRVNVMGEVAVPGTYTLPSLATVFHALYAAGGIGETGSLRHVRVFRNGKQLVEVDVYDFIMTGDDSCNVTLQDGDNISIPAYEEIVSVEGCVKRPMRYELKKGETMSQLLAYAGGFTGSAYKKNVNVVRQGGTEYEMHTVSGEDFQRFIMQDGDNVRVDSILNKFANRVSVSGAVFRPGNYALSEQMRTVKQLIGMAEGITEEAFLNRAILYREKEDLTQEMFAVDLGKLLRGEMEDIELRKNDNLYVASKNALKEEYSVTVHGAVKNPQVYPFVENMTLEDVVIYAGGLLESASEMRIDVSRRIKDPKSTELSPVEAQLFSFPLKDGLMIDGMKDFVLEPFDEIYVRRSPGYREQQNVRIDGEVLYPGAYAKETTNERISDVIRRAGGVTDKAYVKGARLMRQLNADEQARIETVLNVSKNSLRDTTTGLDSLMLAERYYFVGINLAEALKNPGGECDLVLRAGDVIQVPNYINTVKISGEVLFPNAVTYREKMKLKDYIANAGGFGLRAKKRKVFVVYQNGTVAIRKGGMPKIEPGCEIIVPRKPDRKNRMGLPEIMSLTSSTTSIAAMVTSILNSTK